MQTSTRGANARIDRDYNKAGTDPAQGRSSRFDIDGFGKTDAGHRAGSRPMPSIRFP